MNWTLEVVLVPVSDVDHAKAFYADRVGFRVDFDSQISEELRVAQLTPPGSGCSIQVGTGITDTPPGCIEGLQLVVPDLRAARAGLAGRGVDVTEIQVHGATGPRPAREGEALDNVGFVYFDDPDGNGWKVQQISTRD